MGSVTWHVGAKEVIPVDLASIMYDYDKIFKAVESKKHLFEAVNNIQKSYGRVIVMLDTAHAFDARRNGEMCGVIADFTSSSFHVMKNLTTVEDGMLI